MCLNRRVRERLNEGLTCSARDRVGAREEALSPAERRGEGRPARVTKLKEQEVWASCVGSVDEEEGTPGLPGEPECFCLARE